jgi:hypothetical protein
MATVAGVVRKVGIATWTVLDDRTDRIRCIVSAEQQGYAVRDENGAVLGRFGTVKDALEALPVLCD